MMTVKKAISECFPGRNNLGLRKAIKEILSRKDLESYQHMADVIQNRFALTGKGQGALSTLVGLLESGDFPTV